MNLYDDRVTTRFLYDHERRILTNEKTLPLVISSKKSNNADFLQKIITDDSNNKILLDVAEYGAVLFRGFNIKNAMEFENTILSIKGIKGIGNYFNSLNRKHVDSTKYVLTTSAHTKTGGGIEFHGYHSESYFSPDVPRYIAFCCFKAPFFGGETGLISTQKVFEGLDLLIQNELKKNNLYVNHFSVSLVAKLFNVSEKFVIKICNEIGLNVEAGNVYLYKPSVIKNNITNKESLIGHFGSLPGFDKTLLNHFMGDYNELQWIIHRLIWKIDNEFFKNFRLMISHPLLFAKIILDKIGEKFNGNESDENLPAMSGIFNNGNLDCLATLMRNHHASFLWKPGDMLLLDNTQIAHAGMPGFGPRKLNIMLLNKLEINCTPSAPGVQANVDGSESTFADLLMKGQ